jgi:hypothetical protein
MHPRLVTLGLLTSLLMTPAPASTSSLWGEHGEQWNAGSRLPDFSFAGYHRGNQPIPEIPPAANAKDFGARGDGITDDTKAIQAAIDSVRHGAVILSPGRYVITDYLRIQKSGIVLRGAGPDKTVLWFPKGLDEVHPREMHDSRGLPTSGYSFDGAFLAIEGNYRARPLTTIVANARRGATQITVAAAATLAPDQWVQIVVHEDHAQSLKTFLYGNDPGDVAHGKQLDTKMLVRVVRIDGNLVTLDRPLRFETRASWRPELRAFDPTVTESGIEGIAMVFPNRKYGGHFKENGANAFELRNVANCWIRHVRIHNGDMGVNIVACQNTVDGVVLTADPERGVKESAVPDCSGHHAFQFKEAEDNLVTHFDIQTCYVHDLSVEHASGNVYANGRGRDLALDHHKDTPYENLYTNLDCGRGTRVWLCGGGASLGRHCAGWATFWNLRAARPISPPPADWGPATMNFAGIASTTAASTTPEGRWWEPASALVPADLHAAQWARRNTPRTP